MGKCVVDLFEVLKVISINTFGELNVNQLLGKKYDSYIFCVECVMVLILESMQEFVFKDLRVVTTKYIASGSSIYIYIYILHCHGNVPNYLLFWIVHKTGRSP